MSIRFKKEIQCTMPPGASVSSCSEVMVPIIDWRIIPDPVQVSWQEGENLPFNTSTVITYPELHELEEYAGYTDWRYTHEAVFGSTEYYDVITEVDPNNVTFGANRKAYFQLRWKNFNLLPTGQTLLTIKLRAYAKVSGTETLIEEKTQQIFINNLTGAGNPGFPWLNKTMFEVTYDQIQDTWTGDTLITISGALDPVTFFVTPPADQPAGFEIEPNPASTTAGINRKTDIASIFDTPGIYDFYIGWTSGGFVWGTGIIRVFVTGISNGIKTNIKAKNNFCLDDKFVKITRSNPAVDRLRMILTLKFQLAGQAAETVYQSYEDVFLNNEISWYPGEEINDFFHPLLDLFAGITSESSTEGYEPLPKPKPLFAMCEARIQFQEYDSVWNEYLLYDLGISYWIPGKRPVSFPWLTSTGLRRSYFDSLISVCATRDDFLNGNLHQIAGDLVDLTEMPPVGWLVYFQFSRDKVSFGPLDILKKSGLAIEPGIDPQRTISVMFENQNLVPDWFTFSHEHKKQPEFEFTMTEDLSANRKFKANVNREDTLTLNTGWFWESELELLTELCESNIAFIRINNKWIKAIPMTSKPLAYDSERSMHQQLVEFQILKDER